MCSDAAPEHGAGSAAARLPKRVKEPTTLHQLCETFAADVDGVEALSRAVAESMHLWEIPWCALSAERVASSLASWLLRTDHPVHDRDAHLSLHVSYEHERRRMAIVLGERGRTLPELSAGDDLRTSLGVAGAFIHAHHVEGTGREITVVIKARSAWRVRLTWDRDSFQGLHPLHSHESHNSEQAALASAKAASGRVDCGDADGRLVAVEIQGPDDADDQWTPYFDRVASSTDLDEGAAL